MSIRGLIERSWTSVSARTNRIWVVPAFGTAGAVAVAVLAANIGRVLPESWVPDVQRDTLDTLLTALSTSMLTVTTFSLSIMVAALANASSSATPRATALVMADQVTHAALASFLSAFVYSVIAKTALGIGYFGRPGRFVLLVGTGLVLLWLIVMLIRWIRTLSSLGLISNTLDKLENQARASLQAYLRDPGLGARTSGVVTTEVPVFSKDSGYVTHIDIAALDQVMEDAEVDVHVMVRPGAFVHPRTALAFVSAELDDEHADELRECIQVGADRAYDQDPRYALIALAETAQRALSPGVNDPGTAIQVMARLARVLIATPAGESDPGDHAARVSIVPLEESELISQTYGQIVLDAQTTLPVLQRASKFLDAVAANCTGALHSQARTLQREVQDRIGQLC